MGIKIGITNNIKKRVSTLNTGNTEDLCVLGAIKYNTRKEAIDTEKKLHEQFAGRRIRGEWFDIKYEDVQNIHPDIEDIQYEPDNIKLYHAKSLQNMPTATRDTLLAIAMYMSKQNTIHLDKDMKNTIAMTITVAEQTVNNAINKLVKDGLLKRVSTGKYIVNPYVLSKADWDATKKLQKVYDNES